MIVTKRKLVEVSLQMLRGNGVESPMNRTLKLRPKALDSVRVNFPTNVLALTVADGFMQVPKRLNLVVALHLISSDDRAGLHHFLNQRYESDLFHVFNRLRLDFAFAFDHAEHGSFTGGTTPSFSTAAERITVLAHQKPNLLSNAPSAFVCHSQVPLQFFGSNTVPALAHKEDGVKPKGERRRAFVEDSSFGRIDLEATGASVRATFLNSVKLAFIALGTLQAACVALLEDMRQARFIIGEVSLEIFNRVLHSNRIPKCLLVVKG